ncbi:leucine-rich repeat domain-containing protein [Vagococcus fluvialis]|uniref:leucine-rich repeat domain-containing protein n=1 Tax=Vagococcus fluvialis TaxID=2738 RepID=UPI0032E3F1AA
MKKSIFLFGSLLLVASANTTIVYGEEEILLGEVTTTLEASNQVDSDIFKDESNLLYKIIGEGEVQVGDGEKPIPNLGTNVTIPDVVNHNGVAYQVTVIAPFAFTTYEDEAGNISEDGSNVEHLVLPNTIREIRNKAFYSAIYLRTATFPNGSQLRTIGDNAFSFSGLTKFDLPDTVETIGVNGFNYNNSLAELNISPNSELQSIGEGALKTNPKLRRIYFPSKLSSVGSAPFSGTIGLREIEVSEANPYLASSNGVLFNKGLNTLISYPADKDGSQYQLPEPVLSISDYAFEYNINLRNLKTNNNLKEINDFAFKNMLRLEKIELNEGLERLGRLAFFGTNDLPELIIPNSVSSYDKNPFYELDGMRKIVFGKNTNYIFQGFLGGSFTNLEEIQFNSEKLQIESGAFSFFSSTNQEKLLFTVVSEEAKEELMTKLGINENNIRIIDLVDPVDPKTPVNPVDKDSKVDQNNSNKNNQGNNSDVKIINSHSGKTNQELLPKTNEKKSIISLVLGLGMLGVIPVIMKRKI